MNPIQKCLEMAVDRKGQEILLNSLQPIRLRVGKDLLPITDGQISANEIRQMLSQILTEDEKKSLYENFKLQGVKKIGDVSFKFDFQIDFDGVNGSMVLQNENAQLWAFPAMASESVLRAQGLNLIVGPRRSGKTAAVQSLLAASQGRKKIIAIFSDEENLNFASDGNVLSHYPSQQLKSGAIPQSADLIIIDSPETIFCEKALRLAEEGRSVLLTLPFWNLKMGLQRMLDLCEGSEQSRARRLGGTLQMGLGLRLLPGIEAPLQGAFELLFADSEVLNALTKQNFESIPDLMRSSAEKSGMRSLNQTLFQLLMKRKIEMKTAFEASPLPEELDSLLKKVGI
ncbi:MAG: hypothetical protein ACAH59_04420 [Pseudobdellovibrionaceae bacterium]